MTPRCPTCGHRLEDPIGELTPRQLSVLAYWWMTGSVKKAAQRVGISEQRAKNVLATARLRKRCKTNDDLLVRYYPAVRSFVDDVTTANMNREAA